MLSVKGVIDLLNDNSRIISPLLNNWRNVYFGMSLHTTGACPRFRDERNGWVTRPNYFGEQYQYLFEHLLLNRHPREAESTRNYRLSQYRPITQTPFLQAIETITGAIFQDSNYTVSVDNQTDSGYIWGNNFEGKDLIRFFESKFQTICEDPNGFFVYVPNQAWYETTKEVEPEIWFVHSKDIIFTTNDELIFFREEIAWHVNNIGIFRYAKDGDGRYYSLDSNYGYYAHLQADLPIDYAGGTWNTQGFYESWLVKAKAVADDYISAKSAAQLVDKEASHPFIIAATTTCPQCDGAKKISVPNEDAPGGFELIECKSCKGSGEVNYNPGKLLNAPVEDMDKDLIKIVNPDTAINEYHKENNQDIYKLIERALFLDKTEEAQSGVAKAIDQENQYKFISKISCDYFDRLIPNAIKIITSYRNISVVNGEIQPMPSNFTIVKPTQFQIKTASDLLLDYQTSTTAGMPAFIRAKQSLDYADKQYGGDDALKKKADFISQDDPLFVLSENDKALQLKSGIIDKEAWQYSAKLPMILDRIIREKSKQWFIAADYNAIKAETERIFKEINVVVENIPSQSNTTNNG